jgi:polysaccharide pyruvyl transferase WcaK-like protein
MKLRLKLLNVRYSPNLGDGLLVDCLEWACRRQLPGAEVSSVDLAGRTAYGDGRQARGALLSTLSALPGPARRLVAGAALRARVSLRLRWFYQRQLRDADAVVLGGGNLFSDTDLNFPIKLDAALRVVAEQRLPLWIYGCGVASQWSTEGRMLFEHAVSTARPIDVFVRDRASETIWDERLARASGRTAKVVRDPGLLAARVYDQQRLPRTAATRIGVGIIAPVVLRYHSDVRSSARALHAWFEQLIVGLLAQGREVTLISNGSPEDTAFGRELYARLRRRFPGPALELPEHRTPRALVQTFTSLSAFVGFRLHGLICARSLGMPVFALDWDGKVGAFMASIGRSDHLYNIARHSPAAVLVALLETHNVALEQESSALDDDLAGITELCTSIRTTLGLEPSVSKTG